MYKKLKSFFCLLLFITSINSFAQNDSTDTGNDTTKKVVMRKGFQVGFFIGTIKANNYTAALYNGYGLDVYGHQNTFINSLMYQQIVNINGGANGTGGTDRIAQALGVSPGAWSFGQGDMPYNVKYTIAFTAGLQTRYAFTHTDAILLNISTTRINAAGDFTIETPLSSGTSNGFQNQTNLTNCALVGTEQRVVIQLGYQHVFGDSASRINFFMEGGLNFNMDKLVKNQININGYIIDLTSTYSYQYSGYSAFNSKYLSNVGFGGFLGAGINLNISPRWLMQLVYQPSFDKINIGAAPKYTLQNTLGIRGYYCF